MTLHPEHFTVLGTLEAIVDDAAPHCCLITFRHEGGFETALMPCDVMNQCLNIVAELPMPAPMFTFKGYRFGPATYLTSFFIPVVVNYNPSPTVPDQRNGVNHDQDLDCT